MPMQSRAREEAAFQAFLSEKGETGKLIAAADWENTSLGPIDGWPQSLKAVIRVMLTSRFAMWMAWGEDLRFFCNDAYLPTVGVKRDWVIGSRSDTVWEEIWADIGPRIDRVLTTGEATWDEALRLYLHRSGFDEETYHTFSYSPLADESGEVQGMLCVVAEVTEKVLGERQLALLRDLGARITQTVTRAEVVSETTACLAARAHDVPFSLIYLTGENGETVYHGGHGVQPEDLGLPRGIDPGAQNAFGRALGTGDAVIAPVDASLGAMDWPHWLSPPDRMLLAPIRPVESAPPIGLAMLGLNPHRTSSDEYLGFFELLARQVATGFSRADEFEREKARAAALAEIDRAKTAFFANVSHEFRTPLTLMLAPLEDELGEADMAGARRDRIELAHRNALRLLRLVNSLLDFARIEAGRADARYRPVDLVAMTTDLASSFRAATDRAGLTLTIDADPLADPVYVDPEMWEKIVLNLLSNAFKFTFEGGIHIAVRPGSGFVEVSIADTGTGIAPEHLPKLFERFTRIEGVQGRSFEGSGIGLALVQELVQLHGGTIGVESEPEQGTTFTIRLPTGAEHLDPARVAADPQPPHSPSRVDMFVGEAIRWLPGSAEMLEPADMAPGDVALSPLVSGKTILVVDDNADLRDYMERLLRGHGFAVATAGDGEEGWARIHDASPAMVVSDIMMPRVDGIALLARIRADDATRDLPVILLSARAGEEAKIDGLEAGADDYLVKPFAARELLARVTAHLHLADVRSEAAKAIAESQRMVAEQGERVQLALAAGAIIGTWVWEVPRDHFVGDDRFARSFDLDSARCAAGLTLAEVAESIHPEDRPRVEAAIAKALEQGGPYRCEYRVRQRGGVYRWIEANGRVDCDAQGLAQRFPGVLIDIEHRRTIEQELRAKAGELQAVLDAVPAAIWITRDPSCDEVSGNAFSQRLLRMGGAFNQSKSNPRAPTGHFRVFDAQERELEADELPVQRAARGESVTGFEERIRFDDGTHVDLLGNSTPLLDGEGQVRGAVAAFVDITERKATEGALIQLNETLEHRIGAALAERDKAEEALRQAQKMEAVGQLTGGIAHDFNNLLTVITGNVDIARRALGKGEQARAARALDNAQKGAERATSLTQRLLAFSRRQPLAPKPVNADRLVVGMADLLHRSLGETVQLETITTPGLWLIEADPNQLESALLNLAVNARDAMPLGGKLTIETANARLDEEYSAAHAEVAAGNYVVIAVTDTGEGMARETLARVFDPFFTTKEVGKGTGLGLSMVYGFVKQSGGHVKIYSEEGQGTTVKIYLPRYMSGEAEELEQRPVDLDRSQEGQRILVVEDDDDVRAYTVEILRELGYETLSAHDGPNALQILAHEAPVDLLFTDVVMPGMSGRELADAARELYPDLKVLFTSGYTRNAIVHGGRLDPGVELIAKPFTYQALAEKIAEVLDAGSSGRLLVVEEDATLRMFAVEALEAAGYHVHQAATAGEAMGMVRASGGRYDAVFATVSLPDKSGEAFAREVRALHDDLPILIGTADDVTATEARFTEDRCIAVIQKPYNASMLQAALERLNVRCARS